jgi:hypothetical protein
MILFFDRTVGVNIPKALRYHLNLPIQVEYHQLYFDQSLADDMWLPQVGAWGWFVIGQDYKYHKMPSELAALKEHKMGVFYLWGSTAPRWETMRVFARAYDRIVTAALNTPRPFGYRIDKNGRLLSVPIP